MTISLVVGYLNYRLGQVGNGHLLYVYFGSDWGTLVKIGLLGTMAAPKSGGMHFAKYCFNFYILQPFNLNHNLKFISSTPLKQGMVILKRVLVH